MTKGFTGHGMKSITAGEYLRIIETCKRDVEAEHKNEVRSRGRPSKKVRNKYVGDLYE